jgi:hypothetical protein
MKLGSERGKQKSIGMPFDFYYFTLTFAVRGLKPCAC